MTSVIAYISAALAALELHGVRLRVRYAVIILALLVPIATLAIHILPPASFPSGATIEIPKGASFEETAAILTEEQIISSPLLLKVFLRVSGNDRGIQAGSYYFPHAENLFSIAYRLTHGISGIPMVKVTFPEGTTIREMADILRAAIPQFDATAFGELAKGEEGLLFPDTYSFPENVTPEFVHETLRYTYERRIAAIGPELADSGRTEEEIVTMASLLEKEAKSLEDRRVVAGILWSRIKLGMPLQVDAVFGYIKGIDTYHPSGTDLDIDSPYNTYLHRGLPPGPIANPGVDSLRAALHPIETDYLYYLSGTDGVMHYAKTFEEHKRNKELYL